MRDGLRSRSKLLAEASTGELGGDSTDDNATRLICCGLAKVQRVPDSKEEAEIDESDGLKSEDSDTVVPESTDRETKRSRTDERGGDSEEDSAKKRKSKEHNDDGKAQVVCRVLRSMSAVKSEVGGDSIARRTRRTRRRGWFEDKIINAVKSDNKGDVQRKNNDGNCTERRTRGRSGTEDKSVYVVIPDNEEGVERNNDDGDYIGQRTRERVGLEDKNEDVVMSESEEAVQKNRGRGGSEDQGVNLVIFESKEDAQKKNMDDSCVGQRTSGSGGSEDKSLGLAMEEANECKDEQHNVPENTEEDEELGKQEGPSNSQGSLEVQEKAEVKKEEIDQSADKESHELDDQVSKKPKRKRGRPSKNEALGKLEWLAKSRGSLEGQEKSEVKMEEIDLSADKESHELDDQVSKKLKRKRGRPFKIHESNESGKNLSAVRKGQINQFSSEENNQSQHNKVRLKGKRGRPPKAKEGNAFIAIRDIYQPNNENMKLLRPRRGRTPKAQDGVLFEKKMPNVEVIDQYDSSGSDHQKNEVKDKVKLTRGRPFKLNKGKLRNAGKEGAMKVKKMKCHNIGTEEGNYKKNAGETGHSRSERQAVRDKIVDLLLGAGWEIQYRPRYGREYNDAVYVNPEGRTHWSVTLAYRVLKEYFENDTVDSKTCKPGFKFIPIPEEELSILTKVMSKERSDKNKKKKKRNKEEDESVNGATKKRKWKLNKGNIGPSVGLGDKILKGRPKLKPLHHNNRFGGMKGSGTAASTRGRKGLETHGRKRCGLMVRNSQDGLKSDSDRYFLYNGKRSVLTWMIDLGTLALDGRVEYRNMQAQCEGRIKTDGIQCDCCSKTFTIADFETHAGGESCRPFENIFLDSGSSLLQCQLDSWRKQDEPTKKGFHLIDTSGEDPNDDTCGICGDGGDLICCDGCPSTFHKNCLEIKKFPSGPWHCIYCLCKFCGKVGGNGSQESDDTALSNGLFTCCLCEEKYHYSCVQVKDGLNQDPRNTSFCGEKCQQLYEKLQMLFGAKHELEGGFSWTFVRRYDVGTDVSLSGMPRKVDCNSKVAVALHIMDECFMPMADHRTGVNLIRNIVYNFGSNFNRLKYTGFFTAVLERGDEMVAVASIRIHGNQLAEMPFIGTRYMYRRQGMCRRLLSAIEMALRSLNVEKLVIPAISELRGTWNSVFGFKPFEESSKKILKNLNMVVFPGVDMLQKPLSDHQITEQAKHPKEGSQSSELVTMENRTNEFDETCSVRVDPKNSGETCTLSNESNKVAACESDPLCLSKTCDVIMPKANDVQTCFGSEYLDGRNTNTTIGLDSSSENEKILSRKQICSAGSTLGEIDGSNIAAEAGPVFPIPVEGEILGTLDGRNEILVGNSCNTLPKMGEDVMLPSDSAQAEFNLNNVPEDDDKFSEVIHVESGAANCSGGEMLRASVDSSGPKTNSNVECNPNTLHSTSEAATGLESKEEDASVENGVKVAYSNGVFGESKTSNISFIVGDSAVPEAPQRTLELLTGCSTH